MVTAGLIRPRHRRRESPRSPMTWRRRRRTSWPWPEETVAPQWRTLSVIVPVWNERETLAEIVRRIRAVDLGALHLTTEIVLVDDGSTDGTRDLLPGLAELPGVRVLLLPRNQG